MSVCVLPGSSARHLCGWKSKEEENVCLFERKRLRRKFKKKRIWTDGSRPAFCFCFCFTLEDEIKFRAFFYLPRERERLFVCVQLYQTCRASPSSLSKLNLLTVHIKHIIPTPSNSTVVFFFFFRLLALCRPGPRLKKEKQKRKKSGTIQNRYGQSIYRDGGKTSGPPSDSIPRELGPATHRESCSCTLCV
jgi:hypothetical protein